MRADMIDFATSVFLGLSLANVCMLNIWYHILDTSSARYYTVVAPASRARLLAAFCNWITLGSVFSFSLLAPQLFSGAYLFQAALAILLALQVAVLYRTAHDHLRPLRRALRTVLRTKARRRWVALLAAGSTVVFIIVVTDNAPTQSFSRAIKFLAIAASPLMVGCIAKLLILAHSGYPKLSGIESQNESRRLTGRRDEADCHTCKRPEKLGRRYGTEGHKLKRVVWLVFDELDYGIAFDRRPSHLALPNLDRFCAESFSFTQAFPPAHCTELSMPALISGFDVAGTWPTSFDQLDVAVRGKGQDGFAAEDPRLTRVKWSSQPTVFSRAQELGAYTAMVGWYHPYPRLIGSHLDWCAWHDNSEAAFAVRNSFWGAYVDHMRSLFESGRYSPFGQSLSVQKSARQHEDIRRQAARIVSDDLFDLTLVHWPLPHAPFFYDASSGSSRASNRGAAGYLDQLILTDLMLGEILALVEMEHDCRRSTIILSSDHWWRASEQFDGQLDRRVPFMVRFPQERKSTQSLQKFETRNTADLILKLMTGAISDHDDLSTWLRRF